MPKDTTDLDPRISQLLHRVEKGLVHAAHVDDVFWQVQAIFRANEALAVDGGTLQDWLGRLYVDSVTIALRRQADQRKGVVSLWRLLEMMKGAAPLLTKARYVELHDNDVHHRRAAASHWDRVVAPGHDAIPRPLLKAKQDELRSALSHVSRYANEYVAHAAGDPHDVKMTFEDVRRAMATAFRVFRWCYLVLTADGYSTPVPAIQHPWRRVFQIAWLEPGRPAPAYRSLDELIREGDARCAPPAEPAAPARGRHAGLERDGLGNGAREKGGGGR